MFIESLEGQEAFYDLIIELRKRTVIVEGKRDKDALKKLNIKHIIVISGKPLVRIPKLVKGELEKTKSKEAVILTDFDKQGKSLAAKLSLFLRVHEIKINKNLRRKFMELGKTRIEDFNKTLDRAIFEHGFPDKESDYYVKVGTNVNKISNKSNNKSKRRSRKA